jgi:hypothetical protein
MRPLLLSLTCERSASLHYADYKQESESDHEDSSAAAQEQDPGAASAATAAQEGEIEKAPAEETLGTMSTQQTAQRPEGGGRNAQEKKRNGRRR